ncbi:MAG TPA: hypothetical protein VLB68_27380 [Pyrinomonadaceae bacterium]|nr:hypothetical protein [Pyrinomonadaceae bacterium]
MKRKNIVPMKRIDLEGLSTKRLVARLSSLQRCEESLALSDRNPESYQASNAIEFKDSPEWLNEYTKIKEVLADREHVSKGGELKSHHGRSLR